MKRKQLAKYIKSTIDEDVKKYEIFQRTYRNIFIDVSSPFMEKYDEKDARIAFSVFRIDPKIESSIIMMRAYLRHNNNSMNPSDETYINIRNTFVNSVSNYLLKQFNYDTNIDDDSPIWDSFANMCIDCKKYVLRLLR